MRKIYHRLVTPEDALKIVFDHFRVEPLGVEEVELTDASGRVLAENVYSPLDLPPFDRATMDGYAVRSLDLVSAFDLRPVKLKIIGKLECGDKPVLEVEEGTCVEIATGAPVPPGADSVVMVEYTRQINGDLLVFRSTYPGENIQFTGTDVSKGDLVLRRCTLLTHREIALLAALGINRVKVYKKPRVAIIGTGNELVDPGRPLTDLGKIYDSNTYMLYALLRELGCEPVRLGVVPDDEDMLRDAISRSVRTHDIVLVTGGTSAGTSDITYRVLEKLGNVLVHGLQIRPGKPTVIADVEGKLVIGLPGYPNSALVVFYLLVKPIVCKLLCREEHCVEVEAELRGRLLGAQGRRAIYPVMLIKRGDKLFAYPLPLQQGALSPIVHADGIVSVPENVELLEDGEKVRVRLLRELDGRVDLYVVGSHDLGLELLLDKLSDKYRIKQINIGSLGGIIAVSKDCADVAGTHLVDEETGIYNVPYLEKLNIKNAVLVRGYLREQGIIVQRGNPKNIRSIRDFLRPDVRIVNRNRGAGTRALLDLELKKIAKEENISFTELTKRIRGYTYEVKTHTGVAAAVAQGRADAGLGIRLAALLYNLDFIPLTWEEYDLLVRIESLERNPACRDLISLLGSEWFKKELAGLPGYRALEDTGKIIWRPRT